MIISIKFHPIVLTIMNSVKQTSYVRTVVLNMFLSPNNNLNSAHRAHTCTCMHAHTHTRTHTHTHIHTHTYTHIHTHTYTDRQTDRHTSVNKQKSLPEETTYVE